MDSYNRYSRNVNRDYFWDEPDFESNYQSMEESRKEDWDEELALECQLQDHPNYKSFLDQ